MDYSLPDSSIHGFSRKEYWSGLPFPPPGDLPDPGIVPRSPESPALQADPLPLSQKVYEGPLEQGHPELSWLLSIFSPKAQTEQLRYLLEA